MNDLYTYLSGIKNPYTQKAIIHLSQQLSDANALLNELRIKKMLEQPYGRDLQRIIGATVGDFFFQDMAADPAVAGQFQRSGDTIQSLKVFLADAAQTILVKSYLAAIDTDLIPATAGTYNLGQLSPLKTWYGAYISYIYLYNAINFADRAADPSAAGQFNRYGPDLKFHDGIDVRTVIFDDDFLDALQKSIGGQIYGLPQKVTPVDTDVFLVEDSAASWAKKKVLWSSLPSGGGIPSGVKVLFNTKGTHAGYTYAANLTQWTPCRPAHSVGNPAMPPTAGGWVFQIDDDGSIYISGGVMSLEAPYDLNDIAYTGIPDDEDCGTWIAASGLSTGVPRFNPGYATTKVWDTDHYVRTGWIFGGFDANGGYLTTGYSYDTVLDAYTILEDITLLPTWEVGDSCTIGGMIEIDGTEYFVIFTNAGNAFYYDPAAGAGKKWIVIDEPGAPGGRNFAASFTIDGNWFITCGYDVGTDEYLSDMYVLHAEGSIPQTLYWSGLADFPGAHRGYCFGYANIIGEAGGIWEDGYGVVGCGWSPYGGVQSDVYRYSVINDVWHAMKNFAIPRSNATAIGSVVYAGENDPTSTTGYVLFGDNLSMGARFNDIHKEHLLAVYEKD